MELKIELDMSKIDYDKINKKILEKVNLLSISEVLQTYFYDKDVIRNEMKELIKEACGSYLEQGSYFGSGDEPYRKEIKNIAREIIQNDVKEKLKPVLHSIEQNGLEEIIMEFLPAVLTNILYERMYSGVIGAEQKQYYNNQANTQALIENALQARLQR